MSRLEGGWASLRQAKQAHQHEVEAHEEKVKHCEAQFNDLIHKLRERLVREQSAFQMAQDDLRRRESRVRILEANQAVNRSLGKVPEGTEEQIRQVYQVQRAGDEMARRAAESGQTAQGWMWKGGDISAIYKDAPCDPRREEMRWAQATLEVLAYRGVNIENLRLREGDSFHFVDQNGVSHPFRMDTDGKINIGLPSKYDYPSDYDLYVYFPRPEIFDVPVAGFEDTQSTRSQDSPMPFVFDFRRQASSSDGPSSSHSVKQPDTPSCQYPVPSFTEAPQMPNTQISTKRAPRSPNFEVSVPNQGSLDSQDVSDKSGSSFTNSQTQLVQYRQSSRSSSVFDQAMFDQLVSNLDLANDLYPGSNKRPRTLPVNPNSQHPHVFLYAPQNQPAFGRSTSPEKKRFRITQGQKEQSGQAATSEDVRLSPAKLSKNRRIKNLKLIDLEEWNPDMEFEWARDASGRLRLYSISTDAVESDSNSSEHGYFETLDEETEVESGEESREESGEESREESDQETGIVDRRMDENFQEIESNLEHKRANGGSGYIHQSLEE